MALPPNRGALADARAVLFDLDGTLVETHIDFPAMRCAMRTLALMADVPEAAIAGKDILAIVEAAADHLTTRGDEGAALRRSAFARLEEMEVAGCAHPTLLPGAEELLTHLQSEGRSVGIVTRNCRRVAQSLVRRFGLPHDVLLSRDDVRRTKPDPQHLWDALTRLGSTPPASVMAGDHWMDVQAGRAAGCAATIGVLGAHDAEWFAPCPPTHLVADPAAALPLFGP